MRVRRSARLLIVDNQQRLLLFKFELTRGPLAGQRFWATPGGELQDGESFEAAALRELFEETGLSLEDVGPQAARREAVFRLADGEEVQADERFFHLQVGALDLVRTGWTEFEREVMTQHRWWSAADLALTEEQVWPENILELLALVGVAPKPSASIGQV